MSSNIQNISEDLNSYKLFIGNTNHITGRKAEIWLESLSVRDRQEYLALEVEWQECVNSGQGDETEIMKIQDDWIEDHGGSIAYWGYIWSRKKP